MRTLTSFRKTTLVSFVVILCSGSCHHGSAQSPDPKAANGEIRSLVHTGQITMTALPAPAFNMGKASVNYNVETRVKN
ncbi:MAG: hypothetical protein ABI688_05995 [Bacteroidota bacterium]